ncbi:MAG: ABC transporter ATP-binding protein [Chlorobium sp.]|uniref:ABC transporter ATP-binding protein n=1 Tax=Chlorobium sp. TaxID=1095 RepID=UPI0025BA5566|nr:ABC transporter ATP-binding protein [Chlorobium sp.]MCF8382909.1 ABC transporter ATP-binding protein [Chlorobium sp.]
MQLNASGNDSHQAVLKISGLSKTYLMGEVRVEALKNVSIEFFSGELAVLLGASGSGKSTLLNIIGGLDVPSEGRLYFNGQEITAASEAELTAYRRRSIGFVFQFYNLISSLSALENVQLVTEIADNPMPADEALRLVGLSSRLNHFPAQLSGGEQQRVAIARAVAKRPELLLCDEPTGALDYQTGKLVLEVIEKVNRELGTTTLVITHNASIAGMADRVVRLGSGEVTEDRRNLVRLTPSELVW